MIVLKQTGTNLAIFVFFGGSIGLFAEDLKRMADSELISIQSHTATHPNLKNIQKYEYELKESKEKIEKITGKPVIALAYPYGDVNEKVIAETKKYYKYGLTTTPGPFIESGIRDELYQLPRIYIKYSTTLNEFAKILHESRK